MTTFQILQVMLIAAVNAIAQVFLKKAGVKEIGWEMLTNKMVWLGAILYISAFWFWVKVINELEMSVAVPVMTGVMYALSLFLAWYVFKEQMTVVKGIGVFFILIGVIFLMKR